MDTHDESSLAVNHGHISVGAARHESKLFLIRMTRIHGAVRSTIWSVAHAPEGDSAVWPVGFAAIGMRWDSTNREEQRQA